MPDIKEESMKAGNRRPYRKMSATTVPVAVSTLKTSNASKSVRSSLMISSSPGDEG